jgi:hypothetical protein
METSWRLVFTVEHWVADPTERTVRSTAGTIGDPIYAHYTLGVSSESKWQSWQGFEL